MPAWAATDPTHPAGWSWPPPTRLRCRKAINGRLPIRGRPSPYAQMRYTSRHLSHRHQEATHASTDTPRSRSQVPRPSPSTLRTPPNQPEPSLAHGQGELFHRQTAEATSHQASRALRLRPARPSGQSPVTEPGLPADHWFHDAAPALHASKAPAIQRSGLPEEEEAAALLWLSSSAPRSRARRDHASYPAALSRAALAFTATLTLAAALVTALTTVSQR